MQCTVTKCDEMCCNIISCNAVGCTVLLRIVILCGFRLRDVTTRVAMQSAREARHYFFFKKKLSFFFTRPAGFPSSCPSSCSGPPSRAPPRGRQPRHLPLRIIVASVSFRAAPGIEPGTSRTRSENHSTRPSSL